jgi:hypothetical protein
LLQLAAADLTFRGYDTDGRRTDAHRAAREPELGRGGHLCGRRIYQSMLQWETDPSMRDNELGAAFANLWCAFPKVAFTRTPHSVRRIARLAEASVASSPRHVTTCQTT